MSLTVTYRVYVLCYVLYFMCFHVKQISSFGENKELNWIEMNNRQYRQNKVTAK